MFSHLFLVCLFVFHCLHEEGSEEEEDFAPQRPVGFVTGGLFGRVQWTPPLNREIKDTFRDVSTGPASGKLCILN